jgi:hypothetical protein
VFEPEFQLFLETRGGSNIFVNKRAPLSPPHTNTCFLKSLGVLLNDEFITLKMASAMSVLETNFAIGLENQPSTEVDNDISTSCTKGKSYTAAFCFNNFSNNAKHFERRLFFQKLCISII